MATKRLCSIPDCDKPSRNRGFCQSHYHRLRRYGDPLGGKLLPGNYPSRCTIDGCDEKHEAKGFCHKHYQRFKLHGDPLGSAWENRSGDPCLIPECDDPTRSQGYCSKHYQRLRTHGHPLGGRTYLGALQKFLDEHVNYRGDGCLTWPFSKNKTGCCPMNVGGRWETPTRIMCRMVNGPEPSPIHEAAHSCGNGTWPAYIRSICDGQPRKKTLRTRICMEPSYAAKTTTTQFLPKTLSAECAL
jgi:hypothetical protein